MMVLQMGCDSGATYGRFSDHPQRKKSFTETTVFDRLAIRDFPQ
jgi:hypothetical protein